MNQENFTINDNRTGQSYDLPVENATIRAIDLRQIKVDPEEFGTMTYDPGYTNTASCKSEITYIDGEKGILRYRGYPIEQLAEQSSFLEVAYLLIHGELPSDTELSGWQSTVKKNSFVHENLRHLMQAFHYDAHPMGMLSSALSLMSTLYPEAKDVGDEENRQRQIVRILGQMPNLVALCQRHRQGRPFIYPDTSLDYSSNFLHMLHGSPGEEVDINPVLARALNELFILHADHEQNCSASVMRSIGSAEADPYSSMAGAIAALSGPLHGGANEAVLNMLDEIGDAAEVPIYIERVKKREFRLMGFGHRVYKNYDPRAKLIKKTAYEVFEITGSNPQIDIAIALEQAALSDEFFVQRNLYPNVDFYSGIIYQAMGFSPAMFTALFALGRAPGWLAQWNELLNDSEQRIARPRQVYLGHDERDYTPMDQR